MKTTLTGKMTASKVRFREKITGGAPAPANDYEHILNGGSDIYPNYQVSAEQSDETVIRRTVSFATDASEAGVNASNPCTVAIRFTTDPDFVTALGNEDYIIKSTFFTQDANDGNGVAYSVIDADTIEISQTQVFSSAEKINIELALYRVFPAPADRSGTLTVDNLSITQ